MADHPAARAERAYLSAHSNYAAHPLESAASIRLARACSDFADFATSEAECLNLANEGIRAARQLLSREPDNAAAHYYLALNLGKIAQIKRMSALNLVSEMETELLAACRFDEKFDFAGPHRCLGLIYQDAPGWPLSIGSRKKAQQHFLRAVELFPNYPDNRLCLAEAYLKWGDHGMAAREVATLTSNWTMARALYCGEAWESIWNDWQNRLDTLNQKLQKKNKSASEHAGRNPMSAD